jgi:hypothetical protein
MSKLSMGHHNAWIIIINFTINILNHKDYSFFSTRDWFFFRIVKHVVEPMNHHGPILGD